MANNTILIKRSNVPGKLPVSNDLLSGELALNTNDGKIFTKINYTANNNPVQEIVQFVSKIPVGNALFVSKNGYDDEISFF